MANTKAKTKANTKTNTKASTQAKKPSTGLIAGVAVAAVVVIAVVVAIIVNNKGNNGAGGGSGSSQVVVDTDAIDETISFGDYDGMFTLSKSIQNGEMVGKTVKIEGLVSHPMTTYSVVQANADGSQKIGTKFVIDGADEAAYPKDGDRIVITGKVIEESPMVFVIKTAPTLIEVVE